MNEPLYTYYKIILEDSPLDWDETICETLTDVYDVLKYLDIHFDDPDCTIKATITGIGMTKEAYKAYKENLDFES